MSHWSGAHRAFAVEQYLTNGKSLIRARRAFSSHFDIRRLNDAPSTQLIWSWVQRFRQKGTLVNRPPPGPSTSATTPEHVAEVRREIMRNPRKSVRKIAALDSLITSTVKMSNSLVQYVLLRSDLLKDLGWSVGALVAQACHASTAALHIFKDDEQTILYLNDLENMHKVVLEVPNEESLKKIAEKLKENSISHKLWIEQPENIPTCLALKPYPKEEVKKYVGKFKLYKATMAN